MPIRRTIKNMVRNYTDNEVKVREATSNDPWGPSSTLMSEIADLTHNAAAFTEIMSMVWKRLNDKNKNWRHVYKSLVLLEYIIKTGSEKVAQQCKQNIFAIQTLKDFQYIEDNKDHGMNVREKAKYLVSLIADEERLKTEREKALNAKKRLAETPSGISSNNRTVTFGRGAGMSSSPSNLSVGGGTTSHRALDAQGNDIDSVRPQTEGEEELQLQLALAVSREEHEQEERKRRGDEAKEDMKLKMVLEESQREDDLPSRGRPAESGNLFSLVDTSLSAAPASAPDPWSTPSGATAATAAADPWGGDRPPASAASDPWASGSTPVAGATAGAAASSAPIPDPWSGVASAAPPPSAVPSAPAAAFHPSLGSATDDDFAALAGRTNGGSGGESSHQASLSGDGVWSMEPMRDSLGSASALAAIEGDLGEDGKKNNKSPSEFLGENANLVNLDNLLPKPTTHVVGSTNPFATSVPPVAPTQNPFAALQPPKVPLNQLMAESKQVAAFGAPGVQPVAVGNPWAESVPVATAPAAPAYPFGATASVAQTSSAGYPAIQSSNPFL